MSRRNVEIAEAYFKRWEAGGPDAVRELLSEDFEFHYPPNTPDAQVVEGRDAAAARMKELVDLYGKMSFDVQQIRPSGFEVVALGIIDLHGAGSGIDMRGEFAQVLLVEEGLIRRQRNFLSWDQALAAAGLPAEGPASKSEPGGP